MADPADQGEGNELALEHAADPTFVIDPAGRIRTASASASEALGYTPEQLTSLHLLDIETALDAAGAIALRDRIARDRTVTFEGAHRRADGSVFPVETRVVAVEGPPQTLWLATARDLTARRQATQDLRDSERRFRQIVETAREGFYTASLDGRFTFANAAMGRILGAEPGELLGRSLFDFVGEEDHDRLQRAILAQRDGGALSEWHICRADGSRAWVLTSSASQRDGAGEVIGLLALVTDITDRKQAETRLRESEQFKTAILDSSLDALVAMDAEGRIIEFNPAAESLLGWSREEVLGREMAGLMIPARLRGAHVEALTRHLATGESTVLGHRLELSALHRDGHELPVEVSVTRTLDDPPVFSGQLRDLTDQRAAQSRTASLQARLERAQRLESIGQLAGGIAHDFNNLLAVILNYAAFVAGELGDDHPVASDVGEIRHAAERAAALTQQLLVFSRREVVTPELIDLNRVVRDTKRLVEGSLGDRIELRIELAPELPLVRSDLAQIEQVLVNLAVNARDAMPRGGRLSIETAPEWLSAADAEPDGAGAHARLTVADTGVGMTPEVLERAFEPFFTTKPAGSGTGLGMATVYGIVREAGGHVRIDSAPGRGTAVHVHLPAVEAAAPSEAGGSRSEPERPGGRGETILLVEDEEPVRALTRRILEGDGYRVLAASDAHAALELNDRNRGEIDVLLTDLVMPELSGEQLAASITGGSPGGPAVIFMSGYAHTETPRRGELGAGFLAKPFQAEGLLRAVRDALDAREADGAPAG